MLVRFGNYLYLCRQSGKDPLGRRSVMLQLADENLGNFQASL